MDRRTDQRSNVFLIDNNCVTQSYPKNKNKNDSIKSLLLSINEMNVKNIRRQASVSKLQQKSPNDSRKKRENINLYATFTTFSTKSKSGLSSSNQAALRSSLEQID